MREVAGHGDLAERWTGDNAGEVVGREPNTLIVTLTFSDGDLPEFFFSYGMIENTTWYYDLKVTCLTPGARDALATRVQYIDPANRAYSIGVTEADWGDGKDPWESGVHLFSVEGETFDGQSGASTLATAVIHSSVPKVSATEPGQAALWFKTRDQLSSRNPKPKPKPPHL